jgi:hypothetical protein
MQGFPQSPQEKAISVALPAKQTYSSVIVMMTSWNIRKDHDKGKDLVIASYNLR